MAAGMTAPSVDEAHLPLLALPDSLVDRIACLLPPGDRSSLAVTCTALRAASRRWFRGVVVRVRSGDSRLAELKTWVEERQALVAYNLARRAQHIQADLAALPAGHVIAIRGWAEEQWAASAVLAPLTALTELLLQRQIQLGRGSQLEQTLQPLLQLRNLSMVECQLAAVPSALSCCTQLLHLDLSFNRLAGGWQHLQPLAQLQHLDLSGTAHLPASLEQLTQLTGLDLSSCGNVPAFSHQLTALRGLQDLNLSLCGLTVVPKAVSALTALDTLWLGLNLLAGGFNHLRPLTPLQRLYMHDNGLAQVPAAISALTALRDLTLRILPSGWQYLHPLAQLRYLDAFSLIDSVSSDSQLLLASEAAANLHPAAVQRMLAEPDGALSKLLNLLAQRGLPRPV